MQNFEKLDVWKRAITFADQVYAITRRFPDVARFGLTNQMRRAAVSVSSNSAEGSSRSCRQDFARFLEIATGSLFEVISQATIARNQGFMAQTDYQSLYEEANDLIRMLSGLRKSLPRPGD
jgi:four helix bundle protein